MLFESTQKIIKNNKKKSLVYNQKRLQGDLCELKEFILKSIAASAGRYEQDTYRGVTKWLLLRRALNVKWAFIGVVWCGFALPFSFVSTYTLLVLFL